MLSYVHSFAAMCLYIVCFIFQLIFTAFDIDKYTFPRESSLAFPMFHVFHVFQLH